jgi:hypothetical protein
MIIQKIRQERGAEKKWEGKLEKNSKMVYHRTILLSKKYSKYPDKNQKFLSVY